VNVGAASTVGTLTHNGSAVNGLALGANSITVSGDYTNANAGSGNAFNRRANVTGTGQILAGGDAAQVITGAAVTGGNTANATLTIGNVRVGTNTFGYTIGNGGTTGPTLRGAIQTSVNGANITDARLSGSGVTAGNYNAGAPAGNSGNLGVTFTAASAGALAPIERPGAQPAQQLRQHRRPEAQHRAGRRRRGLQRGRRQRCAAPVHGGQPARGRQPIGRADHQQHRRGAAFSEDLNASFGAQRRPGAEQRRQRQRTAGRGQQWQRHARGCGHGTAGAKTGTVNDGLPDRGRRQRRRATGWAWPVPIRRRQSRQRQRLPGGQRPTGGTPLNFGTVQVGQQVSQNLVVRNTASGPRALSKTSTPASAPPAATCQISGTARSAASLPADQPLPERQHDWSPSTRAVRAPSAGPSRSTTSAPVHVGGVSNGLGTAGVGSESFGVRADPGHRQRHQPGQPADQQPGHQPGRGARGRGLAHRPR
jgi:hypothetical protein